jgi:hypothetical protein
MKDDLMFAPECRTRILRQTKESSYSAGPHLESYSIITVPYAIDVTHAKRHARNNNTKKVAGKIKTFEKFQKMRPPEARNILQYRTISRTMSYREAQLTAGHNPELREPQ